MPPLIRKPLGRAAAAPGLSFGRGWRTDFSRHTVPYTDFLVGHPRRDGIPPIDAPRFEAAAQADRWLVPHEPVVVVCHDGETRAYPLAILLWHEIVNDAIGDLPVVVTFCPLCNIALAFDRRVGGQELTFGVSGLLRGSDLVLWDRQTESLWQQATGDGLVGALAGESLLPVPALLLSWQRAAERYPDSAVLSRETGARRAYGENPYADYEQHAHPLLLSAEPDRRLPPLARVVGLQRGGVAVAYPFALLARAGVINDEVGGEPIAVFYQAGMVVGGEVAPSARSHEMGTAWSRRCDQGILTFAHQAGLIVDRETGSQWDITGRAEAGPLRGSQLEPVVHANHFWFAFAALVGAQAAEQRIYAP